jgi:hypothetical protein
MKKVIPLVSGLLSIFCGPALALDAASIPTKIPTYWASSAPGANVTCPMPIPSQISIAGGRASWTDGFPPVTFLPAAGGGIPPFGQDFNGVLCQISQWVRWFNAGGAIPYDPTFQSAINGYPNGAVVESGVTPGIFWQSSVDNNTSDPDTGGANWRGFPPRQKLAGATTFYVSSAGSDSNNCLASDSGHACLTIQHVINILQTNYDLGGFAATVQVADGTFAGVFCSAPFVGGSSVTINGDAGTPANVIVNNGPSAGTSIFAQNGCILTVTNLSLGGTTFQLFADIFGAIYANNVNFLATSPTSQGAQMSAQRLGYIELNSATISGSAGSFAATSHMGNIRIDSGTIKFLASVTYGTAATNNENAFLVAISQSDVTITNEVINLNGQTVSGSQYWSDGSWVQSAISLPGSVTGSGTNGGRYNGIVQVDLVWPGIASTSYSPSTATTGGSTTFGAVTGVYKQFGKLTYFNVNFNVTSSGTGSGQIQIGLPVTSAYSPPAGDVIVGFDVNANKALVCSVTSNVAQCNLYDGTFPGVSGHGYNISGTYYAQ